MRTETVSKAEDFVSFSVSASYCSITSFSHAVTHPFRTVSCSALFFSAQSVSGSTAPAAGPYSCHCMAELQNKKRIHLCIRFLYVCLSFISHWYYLSRFANSFISLALSSIFPVTFAPPSIRASSRMEASSSRAVMPVSTVFPSVSFCIR